MAIAYVAVKRRLLEKILNESSEKDVIAMRTPSISRQRSRDRLKWILLAAGVACYVGGWPALGRGSNDGPPPQLPTTLTDFYQHGTQQLGNGLPGPFDAPLPSIQCNSCHANYGPQDPFFVVEQFKPWAASMLGQSARDPLFHAALTIANQVANDAGTFCIRCHAPVAFLNGHDVPTDASAFQGADFEGVSCNICHRMVNPTFVSGQSPAQDQQILADLQAAGLTPPQGSNARYVVDPTDSRRGPFNDIPVNIHPGNPQPEIIYSPFHTKAELCWTCHDVSNPLMMKQGTNQYALGALDAEHPTGQQTDMLPIHRTYSEWKNSYYSTIGVDHDGRFGGNHPTGIMFSCQDCHLPRVVGYGSNLEFEPFFERPDVPQHSFLGSNYWVLNAVRTVDADNDGQPDYPDSETYLSEESVGAAVERNIDFLQKASDLEISKQNNKLKVRVLNMSGHKLPTGFPDGRRIWINVKFYDCNQQIIEEKGAYDFETATLTKDTKIYEMHLGIQGAAYAAQVGQPEGHTFHFILANAVLKDNRIFPAGHSNNLAVQNQTAAVGAVYANGQNWDDTLYTIPTNARKAVVTVYYQLTSREFIEFLRDENFTNNKGQVAYDLWVQSGMSPPVTMDVAELDFFRQEDVNQDGTVNVVDMLSVINGWGVCPNPPQPCPNDINADGLVNVLDLLAVINAWGSC